MKVLLVSTSYPSNSLDWKGQFIRNLVFALSTQDEIQLLLWTPPGETPKNVEYCATLSEKTWLQNLLNQGGIASLLRTKPVKGAISAINLLAKLNNVYRRNDDVDLIHVNWLQNALPLAKNKKPLVVSVLGSDIHQLRLPGMISSLRKAFRRKSCILCPNASWMQQPLENHFGDVAKVVHIPYGINEQLFELNAYQQPTKPRKWLAIIRVTKDKVGTLFSWGENVFDDSNTLHLLGPMQEKVSIPNWCHYEGATNPEQLLQHWLPTAAGLITLSRHAEGLPQIILEAMAAGVPVIASDIPAHKSVIKHRETGWLVTSKDSLKQGLVWLDDPTNRQRVAQNAKQWVTENIGTWQDCAKRFIHIYQTAMD